MKELVRRDVRVIFLGLCGTDWDVSGRKVGTLTANVKLVLQSYLGFKAGECCRANSSHCKVDSAIQQGSGSGGVDLYKVSSSSAFVFSNRYYHR